MEDYKKIKVIGKGSFGSVNLVKNIQTNEEFAMKKVIIDSEKNIEPINECNLLSSLDHANIIKLHKYILLKEKICIIMEYADDGDLYQRINESKNNNNHLDEKKIMNWFAQICLAIKFLFDKNILHRDIKPQNILLMKTGLIKLGDFGISKKLKNADDLAQTSVGTPFYLSPELCTSIPYGHKSDIWMLGCLLYELCALERPFDGKHITTILNSILFTKPKPIPNFYSPFIGNLIDKLLNKDESKRPNINEIVNMSEISIEILKVYEQFPNEYLQNKLNFSPKEIDNGYLNPKEKRVFSLKPQSSFKASNPSNLSVPFQEESKEFTRTPSNTFSKSSELNKNSILNLIEKAKKPSSDKKCLEVQDNSNDFKIDKKYSECEAKISDYDSFAEYLSNKIQEKKKNTNNNNELNIDKESNHSIKAFNKLQLKNLIINDERSPKLSVNSASFKEEKYEILNKNKSPSSGFKKINDFDEKYQGELMKKKSPSSAFKKNTPKNIKEFFLFSYEGITPQRVELIADFYKKKFGNEKFNKAKKTFLDYNEILSEGNKNEIYDIIGEKNIDFLKFMEISKKI